LLPQKEVIPKARDAANRALEMDPELAEGHISLGLIAENYDWDWAAAGREFRRAIELEPNSATAHHWFAEYLSSVGRFGEAIGEIKRAQELDPVSPIVYADGGKIFWFARNYDEAIAQDKKALELEPRFSLAAVHLSLAFMGKGMFDQAIAELEQSKEWDDTPLSLSILGYCYASAGQKDKALRVLDELRKMSAHKRIDPAFFTRIYIALGDKDRAFAGLERENASRSSALVRLKVSPIYDPLRSDPRFQDLLRRIAFPC